jgi:hypothetical protein
MSHPLQQASFVDFHKKRTAFGNTDVRANRRGQDPAQTPMWISTHLRQSPGKQSSAQNAGGWFHKGKGMSLTTS